MLEIKIEYKRHKDTRYKGGKIDEWYEYSYISVKGHAITNDGIKSSKLCGAITAILQAIPMLLDDYMWDYEIKNGCATIERLHLSSGSCVKENISLDTIVCQLYALFKQFPSYFKRFDLINIEEREVQND